MLEYVSKQEVHIYSSGTLLWYWGPTHSCTDTDEAILKSMAE